VAARPCQDACRFRFVGSAAPAPIQRLLSEQSLNCKNEATLDDFIHVTFTVSPEIRRLAFHEPDTLPIEDFYFKYRMAKGIRPLPQPLSERGSVWIILAPQNFHPPRLEFEAFLSEKRFLTDPTFRELFGDEALDESQNIGIKNITFLVSDLKGSTALYDAIGDVQGYHLVRRHFAALTRAVAGHSGAIIKTIGDNVMATFADPVDAISAAIDIVREVEEMNRTLSERLCLKMGIHGGYCLLVTLNNRLDYFGQTVNIAYRLLRLARGGELCLSHDICENPR
jgi:Adenylate and Guanylate cyclase catalytic domain/Family of unknown function (DUF5939)